MTDATPHHTESDYTAAAQLIAQYHHATPPTVPTDTPLMVALNRADALRMDVNRAYVTSTATESAIVSHWVALIVVHSAACRAGRDTADADAALDALLTRAAVGRAGIGSLIAAYLDTLARLDYTLRDTTTHLWQYRHTRHTAMTSTPQDVGAVDTDTDNPILQAARDYMTADALAQDVSTDESDTESDTAQDVTHD